MTLQASRIPSLDRPRRDEDRGNVLFLVLIAVALFAALSYVVAQSQRSSDNAAISRDRAAVLAGELFQYATGIEIAMEKMRITHGVQDWQFDMWAPDNPGNANGSCATDQCRVFAPQGGGVVRKVMDKGKLRASASSTDMAFYSLGIQNVGTGAPELMLWQKGISSQVCKYINYKMGVTNALDATIPTDSHGGAAHYVGTLTSFPGSAKMFGNGSNTFLAGKRDFCYYHAAHGYIFVHVLLSR